MTTAEMKRCSVCGETKERVAFYRFAPSKDGLMAACKACHLLRAKVYRSGTRERRKRVDWAAGTFQCCKCMRTLPLSCFHVRRQRGNQPRSTCKECLKMSTRQWLTSVHGRAWKANYERAKRRADPAYRAAHRAIVDANRAVRRGASLVGERFSREEIYARDKGRCHLCGKRARKDAWDLEHVIPLSKGGTHTRSNVAVSHPACNGQKSAQITHLF